MRRLQLAALAAVLAMSGALAAQATLPITGSVQDDAENMHLVEVDFGAVAQSITLTLQIAATTGISGLDVGLFDLDELALAGTATGIDSDSNSGTGMITVSLTTPMYDGVRQFAVILETFSLDGPSGYSGNLETADLAAGSLIQTGFHVHVGRPGFFTFWGRAARFVQDLNSAATLSRTVQVDFGATAQAMTFWVQGAGFGGDGTVEVYEIPETGPAVLLGSVNGTGFWIAEDNHSLCFARLNEVDWIVTASGLPLRAAQK